MSLQSQDELKSEKAVFPQVADKGDNFAPSLPPSLSIFLILWYFTF